MSLAGMVLGTILQLMLAFFLFMLVAVSGGGASDGAAPDKVQIGILNFSLYALPATCLVSAGIVLYLYLHGSGPSSYWWHGLPLVATALYVVYVLNLGSGA
ncbi:MAG: hypothetical protein ABI040_11160 [Rhodoferax sp.]